MIRIMAALALAQAVQPGAAVQPPLPPTAEFVAADALTRRAVMKLADVRIDTDPGAAFALIEAGLRDEDAAVRQTAAGALRNVRFALAKQRVDPRVASRIGPPVSFVDSLSAALDSPDAAVRFQSIGALVYFDRNTDRTRARLLERYALEDAPLLRAELLTQLREVAPDDSTVRRVVLAALDDPVVEVRYQGILGVAAWTPEPLLSRAGQGLDEQDATMRMAWAEALAAYGSRAAPYLERMRQLLAAETNTRERRRLQAAMASMSPTPAPAAAPR
jgi:hypothetical protein